MIKAYFSSEPNTDLLKIVDDFLQQALVLAQDHDSVGLDIMRFSFTDEALLERLKQIIASRKIKLRIIADWGNISNRDNRQLLNLLSMMSESFQLRFNFDLTQCCCPCLPIGFNDFIKGHVRGSDLQVIFCFRFFLFW